MLTFFNAWIHYYNSLFIPMAQGEWVHFNDMLGYELFGTQATFCDPPLLNACLI